MLVAKTTKGKGVSYMENVPIWHYRSPNKEEYQQAIDRIGGGAMRNTFSEALYQEASKPIPTSTSSSPTSRRPAAWRSSASNIPSASSMSASPSRA